ncbi:hypothetical protein PIB30_092601, partial [Stylosanthes scabra]|nr:hypothetical protein [Stylosanthes scabra]
MDGVVTAVVEKKRLSKEGPTRTSMTGGGGASQRGPEVKGEVARMATSAAGGWREDDEKEGKEFVSAEEKTHSGTGATGNGGAPWRSSSGSVVPLLLVVCINERLGLMEPPFKLQQALMTVEMLNPLQVWLGSEVFQAQGPLRWSHIGTWSKKKEFDDYGYDYTVVATYGAWRKSKDLVVEGCCKSTTIADSGDEIIPDYWPSAQYDGNTCMMKRRECINRCKMQNSNNEKELEKCIHFKCRPLV